MTDFTDDCIVLKISDHGDDDRLAKALTAAHGLVTVRFRGVKKAKAKLKPFAQMFAVFNSRLTSKAGAFLTPIEPMLIQDGFSLCSDLKVFAAASVAAEATAEATFDEQAHTDIFLEFLKFLQAIQTGVDPFYTAAVYMLRLLGLSGFYREYTYTDKPLTPQQLSAYASKHGYDDPYPDRDLSRRALKFVCSEFSKDFDTGLKSVESIDTYGKN